MIEKTILFALIFLAALSTAGHAATAIDLGLYTCTPQSVAEGGICKTQPDYSGAVCDAAAGKCYVFGGGHSATYRDDVDVFDFATLTWTPAGPSTPCADMTIGNLDRVQGRWLTTNHPMAQHTYDLRALLLDGRIISMSRIGGRGAGCNNLPPISATYPNVISASTINYYTPATDTWSYTNAPALDYNSAIELDPISGKVVVASKSGLWLYDTSVDVLTKIVNWSYGPTMGWSASLIYAPITDKFYWMGLGGNTGYIRTVFEITLNRTTPSASTIINTGAVLPAPSRPCCSMGWAYDTINNVIGGGVDNSTLYTFDPVTHLVAAQQLVANDGLIIDPMHGYVAGFGAGGYMFRSKPVTSGAMRTWFVPQ